MPDDDNPLLDIVDVIKVDFREAAAAQRAALAKRFGGRARLLAEKVETRAEQAAALDLGYELLQGYYLHEPVMVARRTIDRTRMGVLSVLGAVSKDPMDFAEVEDAVKREVAITDKLLRRWERGDWEGVAIRGDELGIRLQELPGCYARAVEFADSLRETTSPGRGNVARPATDLQVRV
jgi:hypothetical protein